MKDKDGSVIYVGKAVSLRKRLASYFLKSVDSIKTQVLLTYVDKIATIATATEYEALILEDRLIKQYRPRFNIALKDDKSYPYVKITRDASPRVFIGRRKKEDEDVDLFGPYTSAKVLRRALATLRKSFPFRTCRCLPKKVCLHFHLGLCPGPCAGKISRKDYAKTVLALEDFLSKEDAALIEELSQNMRKAVREERFEDAGRLRDRLEVLSIMGPLKRSSGRAGKFLPDPDFKRLGLNKEPERVEAFDISQMAGKEPVGSMVSFFRGVPDKNHYRRFKIRGVDGIDDYAMMREVVRRRYERLLREAKPLPDLIVIDGGRGHLEAAAGVLKELSCVLPMIAIAKNEEVLYTTHQKMPVRLSRASAALRLIQRLRDEAHRFALTYHRLLRKKNVFEK
jgi:excinuclease ABC subunit C